MGRGGGSRAAEPREQYFKISGVKTRRWPSSQKTLSEPKSREWIDRQLIAELRAPLRSGDSELRWTLIGLLLADLAAAGVVIVISGQAVLVFIGAWVAVTVLTFAAMLRFQRYSQGGLWWFLITLAVFLGWNWIALLLVDLTGLGASHPRLAWVIGDVVGVFPLVFTITLLTVKLRRLR